MRQASFRYNIPKNIVHDKTSAFNRGEVTLQTKLGLFTNTCSPNYDELLVDHVKDLSNRSLPLIKKQFLKLASELVESMKVPYRFNKEKGVTGKYL